MFYISYKNNEWMNEFYLTREYAPGKVNVTQDNPEIRIPEYLSHWPDKINKSHRIDKSYVFLGSEFSSILWITAVLSSCVSLYLYYDLLTNRAGDTGWYILFSIVLPLFSLIGFIPRSTRKKYFKRIKSSGKKAHRLMTFKIIFDICFYLVLAIPGLLWLINLIKEIHQLVN